MCCPSQSRVEAYVDEIKDSSAEDKADLKKESQAEAKKENSTPFIEIPNPTLKEDEEKKERSIVIR